jgi:hypothetical protein
LGGLEGRTEGGAVGVGALSLIRSFFGPPSLCLSCGLQRMAIMEPIWVVSEIKENLYRGPQFIFPPFYRKGLIGVWYCNLRNPVKATSFCHPRFTEARPEYKASNISF